MWVSAGSKHLVPVYKLIIGLWASPPEGLKKSAQKLETPGLLSGGVPGFGALGVLFQPQEASDQRGSALLPGEIWKCLLRYQVVSWRLGFETANVDQY